MVSESDDPKKPRKREERSKNLRNEIFVIRSGNFRGK